MTKTEQIRVDRVLKKELEAVAKTRDHLDVVIFELSELREHCKEAWDALQTARDALSRLV